MAKNRIKLKLTFCFFAIVIAMLSLECCNNNNTPKVTSFALKEANSFAFKGEAIDHTANFDKDTIVTTENVESLYRLFKLDTLFNGDYYLVRSKKSDTSSRYLSRLIRMKDGKQIAAHTFYDSEINPNNVVNLGDRIIVGLNSLMVNNYDSTFHYISKKCRVVILSDNLLPIKGYRYFCPERQTYIESLLQNSDSTFYCFIVSGSVDTEQYVGYQFCANDNYKIVGITWNKYWKNHYIQGEQMDFSTSDWGNDISDKELLMMREQIVNDNLNSSDSTSVKERDSVYRVKEEKHLNMKKENT